MAKTLYVGNLPWSATEDDLLRLFSRHAEVISARVASDRETGRSRGFGFVEVPDESAEAAIQAVNGTNLDGRELTVNEARPREERGPRGGGGGRGGYGGGGGGRGGYGGGGGGYGGGGRQGRY